MTLYLKASSIFARKEVDNGQDWETEERLEISELLQNRSEKTKIEALERILKLMATGADVSSFYGSVVQNTLSSTFQLRKLGYLIVTTYSNFQPDLALLSVNAIQKDINDANYYIRAVALRTLSNLRIPMIKQILRFNVEKLLNDPTNFVKIIALNSSLKMERYS